MPSDQNQWILFIVIVVLSYVVGSIPTGYWVVLKLRGIDIREHGSGNTGATNVKRVAGGKTALVVLLIDALKGFGPTFIIKEFLFPGLFVTHVIVAFAAMLGHSKSIFLKFQGGKSAATGLGVVFGLTPLIGALVLPLAFIVFKITRTVSLVTLSCVLTSSILVYGLGYPLAYIIFVWVGSLYVIYLHKANIQRLISGTENKLS